VSEVDPNLIAAYQNSVVTVYLASGDFKTSPMMKTISLPKQLAPCAWVITAHNPRSRVLSPEVNTERQGRLHVLLQGLPSAAIYPALGSSESGDWSETSFAVAGVGFDEITEVARLFEQNAVYKLDESGCSVVLV
jgi:hypothetical protein